MRTFIVTKEEEGMTLLSFLREHKLESDSVKSLKKLIDHKCCRVGNKIERFATRKLKAGDRITLEILEQASPLSILYEDEALLICDKPTGVVSDLAALMRRLPKKQGLILVHRLDKETSGVLILAKTKSVYDAMVSLFEQKKVKKTYLALIKGKPENQEGSIQRPISLKKKMGGQSLYTVAEKGKEALTLWRYLTGALGISLLMCFPITGRTHQIRVHLQSIGYPILGDALYGTVENYPRLLLHAYKISFPHPKTHRTITVTAPLPEIFKIILPYSELG